jgi:hypothetical protein
LIIARSASITRVRMRAACTSMSAFELLLDTPHDRGAMSGDHFLEQ